MHTQLIGHHAPIFFPEQDSDQRTRSLKLAYSATLPLIRANRETTVQIFDYIHYQQIDYSLTFGLITITFVEENEVENCSTQQHEFHSR